MVAPAVLCTATVASPTRSRAARPSPERRVVARRRIVKAAVTAKKTCPLLLLSRVPPPPPLPRQTQLPQPTLLAQRRWKWIPQKVSVALEEKVVFYSASKPLPFKFRNYFSVFCQLVDDYVCSHRPAGRGFVLANIKVIKRKISSIFSSWDSSKDCLSDSLLPPPPFVVRSDWANFEEMNLDSSSAVPVAMETTPAPWEGKASGPAQEESWAKFGDSAINSTSDASATDEGWADFTSFHEMDSSTNNLGVTQPDPRSSSPVAMETNDSVPNNSRTAAYREWNWPFRRTVLYLVWVSVCPGEPLCKYKVNAWMFCSGLQRTSRLGHRSSRS